MGNWVAVRLRQPAPNVDAVGAWVEVRVGDRTTCCTRSPSAAATPADSSAGSTSVSATPTRPRSGSQWPDGEVGPWIDVEAGEFAIIERGRPTATPWEPEEAR